MKRIIYLACLSVIAHFATAQSTAWQQKIDPSLLDKTAQQKKPEFLVVMKQQADLTAARQLKTKVEKTTYVFNQLKQTAQATQEGIKEFLDGNGIAYEPLFIVNAIATSGGQSLMEALAKRPEVAMIADNPHTFFEPPVERGGLTERALEWGVEKINADDVWAMGYRGQGVTVGGQDTGYEWEHPALKQQYRGYHAPTNTVDHNYHWHDAIHAISPLSADSTNPCGLNVPFPCDDSNHGTHTMGTMIGLDGPNEIGVAPEAEWCACRNMERGNGSPFTYLECFQWFLAPTDLNDQNPDPSRAPHVINNSWYCSQSEGCNPSNWFVMEQAVNNLRLAGIVVVVSAGNFGNNCSTVSAPPALFEGSFSVGATDINDTIAGFSSFGPVVVDGSGRLKPNVSAPGVNVRSAIRFGGYASFSGTSMAGPHVAGLVALIISANPDLAGQVEVIEDIVEQTAVPLFWDQACGGIEGFQVPNNTYGYGRVDALAAVEEALSLSSIHPGAKTEVSFQVYPNPVGQYLHLKSIGQTGPVQFEVFGMDGKMLFAKQWEVSGGLNEVVDFSGYPPGFYVYRLLAGGAIFQDKLIKSEAGF